MAHLKKLEKHLEQGNVYRRHELVNWSNAVDRDLATLVKDGTIQKVSQAFINILRSLHLGHFLRMKRHLSVLS